MLKTGYTSDKKLEKKKKNERLWYLDDISKKIDEFLKTNKESLSEENKFFWQYRQEMIKNYISDVKTRDVFNKEYDDGLSSFCLQTDLLVKENKTNIRYEKVRDKSVEEGLIPGDITTEELKYFDDDVIYAGRFGDRDKGFDGARRFDDEYEKVTGEKFFDWKSKDTHLTSEQKKEILKSQISKLKRGDIKSPVRNEYFFEHMMPSTAKKLEQELQATESLGNQTQKVQEIKQKLGAKDIDEIFKKVEKLDPNSPETQQIVEDLSKFNSIYEQHLLNFTGARKEKFDRIKNQSNKSFSQMGD